MNSQKIINFLAWTLAILLGILGLFMIVIVVVFQHYTFKHIGYIVGVFSMCFFACPASPFLKTVPMWKRMIVIGILGALM